MDENFVVIYGSMASLMATPAGQVARIPRDIDIAVGGSVSFDDAEKAARAFVAARLRGAADDAAERLDGETRGAYGRTLLALAPVIAAGESARETMLAMEREATGYIGNDPEYRAAARAWLDGSEAERQRDAIVAAVKWPGTLRDLADFVASGRLPADVRRYRDEDGTVVLPTPAGVSGSAVVLSGDVAVRWQDISSIPAILRSGLPARQAADLISQWLDSVGGRMAHCYREFNLLPTGASDRPYTTSGVTALRTARLHVSDNDWSVIVDALGAFGRLLDWMLTHEPSAAVVDRLRGQTPGAAPGLVLCIDSERRRLFTAYGDFEVSFEDAPRVLAGV